MLNETNIGCFNSLITQHGLNRSKRFLLAWEILFLSRILQLKQQQCLISLNISNMDIFTHFKFWLSVATL